MSLWELEIADWGQRLGIEQLSGPKPGVKDCAVEEERES